MREIKIFFLVSVILFIACGVGVFHIRTLVKASVPICDTDKKPIWSDRAGGYGIQDPFGMMNIKRINGDYYNVVGLPISRLYRELKKLSY